MCCALKAEVILCGRDDFEAEARRLTGGEGVRVGAAFPLERAVDAHSALEGRRTTGKVLLIPPPDGSDVH